MKILTQVYHYIVFIFILLTVSVLFMFYMQPIAKADPLTITGWGWTDNFGWVSLSCNNVYAGENSGELSSHCSGDTWIDISGDTRGDNEPEGDIGQTYGVVINPSAINPEDTIVGNGWSDNAGWVRFDPMNGGHANVGEIPSGFSFEHDVRLIYGDYMINSSAETCSSCPADLGECVPDGFCGDGEINIGETCASCPGDVGQCVVGGSCGDGNANISTQTGYILSGWAVVTQNTNPNDNPWISFRANAEGDDSDECVVYTNPDLVNPDNYCVVLNNHNYLGGWAWSDSNTNVDGLGWINFQETFSGGPYIKTQYGDIYGGRTITGSRAPEGAYNATYCIISGSSSDIALSSSQSCLLGNIEIEFPDSATEYTTSIVHLDRDDLRDLAISTGNYHDVEDQASYVINQSIDQIPDNSSLGGLVYYFTGSAAGGVDFNINNALQFNSSPNKIGTGTIVIDGDLYINENITYESGTPNSLSEIPSVAWVILGNVYISPSVTKVVGTFVVLGDDEVDSGKFYTGEYDYIFIEPEPESEEEGTWEYETTPKQLDLSGVVVAREIVLERAYFEGLAPAEIFKYDGRVLLNTPPGLGNFAGYLPEWSR